MDWQLFYIPGSNTSGSCVLVSSKQTFGNSLSLLPLTKGRQLLYTKGEDIHKGNGEEALTGEYEMKIDKLQLEKCQEVRNRDEEAKMMHKNHLNFPWRGCRWRKAIAP